MAFDYRAHYVRTNELYRDYCARVIYNDGTDKLRALRDHLNTHPAIYDDKPADTDLWKLRADYIDASARWLSRPTYDPERCAASAARALVDALDTAGDQVTP